MRRITTWAPWATCAIAMMITDAGATRAAAGDAGVESADAPVAECVRYRQRKAEDGMRLQLDNRCGEALSCTVKWKLTCAREDGEDETHLERERFELLERDTHEVDASAARCGEDAWQVRAVRWSCQGPEPELEE